MSDGAKITIDDFKRAGEQIRRIQPTPPGRVACSFDEAKALILAGRPDLVLVSSRTLERLKADPDLQQLDRGVEADKEGT
jgi:hypothetical protein